MSIRPHKSIDKGEDPTLHYDSNKTILVAAIKERCDRGESLAFNNTPIQKESRDAARTNNARARSGGVTAVSEIRDRPGPAISYDSQAGGMIISLQNLPSISQLKSIQTRNMDGTFVDDTNSFTNYSRKIGSAKFSALRNQQQKGERGGLGFFHQRLYQRSVEAVGGEEYGRGWSVDQRHEP